MARSKKLPSDFTKAAPPVERLTYVRIEVVTALYGMELDEELERALEILQERGAAVITEQYAITDDLETAYSMIKERREKGDTSAEYM